MTNPMEDAGNALIRGYGLRLDLAETYIPTIQDTRITS